MHCTHIFIPVIALLSLPQRSVTYGYTIGCKTKTVQIKLCVVGMCVSNAVHDFADNMTPATSVLEKTERQ